MMYFRFSKLSKIVIIINVILSIVLSLFYAYVFVKSVETTFVIENFMEDHNVIREVAIELLSEQGERLFIGTLLASYAGFIFSTAAVVTLIWYGRTNSFMAGFFSAALSMLTTFVGGLVLFAVFFSNKREVKGNSKGYMGTTDMSKYIHKRLIDEGYDQSNSSS